jgi:magnesium transporter
MLKNTSSKYLEYILNPFNIFRTKEILKVNPTIIPERKEEIPTKIFVYDYNTTELNEKDIQSINQRAKIDEIDNILYCVLNMIYFNDTHGSVESEQISIVLGKNYVITFQEDAKRDVFNPIRDKLKIATSRVRNEETDYLCYMMLDLIVDNYFIVMEKLGERVETLEEDIAKNPNNRTLSKINMLRKEIIVLKRTIAPVRELINGFIKSENKLLNEKNVKYFKDVYDHIVQANDLAENHRDMLMSLQDLYMSNVNLKLNEAMKVMTIVTCLLAPATVIGGIFGMNFENIGWLHTNATFTFAAILMIIIPFVMLYIFRRRGWF